MAKSTQSPKVLPATPVVAPTATAILQAQKAFGDCIAEFRTSQEVVGKARDAMSEAGEAAIGVRQRILCSIASQSIKYDWSFAHAEAGINAAIAALEKALSNQANGAMTVRTVKQLSTECLRAANPKARDYVVTAFSEADERWAEETKRIEDARAQAKADGVGFDRSSVATPLRDAFKRKYHMVAASNGLLAARCSKDATLNELADAPEMLADKVSSDERGDAKRAKRMMLAAMRTLEALAAEFPSPRWDVTIEFLNGVDVKQLVKWRDASRRRPVTEARTRAAAAAQPAQPAKASKPQVTTQDVNAAVDDLMAE